MSTVLEYLVGMGSPFLVLPRPGAVTAEETAAAHDVALEELVRTEVLISESGPALAVVPASRSLDLEAARSALDDPEARAATVAEIANVAAGCRPESVPPLGLWLQAPMFVDPVVADLSQVVFAAGRPSLLVCMERDSLFGGDPYAVVPLTSESLVSGRRSPDPVSDDARPFDHVFDLDLLPVHVADPARSRTGVA